VVYIKSYQKNKKITPKRGVVMADTAPTPILPHADTAPCPVGRRAGVPQAWRWGETMVRVE